MNNKLKSIINKKTIIIMLLSLICIIIAALIAINMMNSKREQMSYLTDVKFDIYYTMMGLDGLKQSYSTGNYDILSYDAGIVSKNMFMLDQLLLDGRKLAKYPITYGDEYRKFAFIGGLFTYSQNLNAYEGNIPEDNRISENEIKFINRLYADLDELKSLLVEGDGWGMKRNVTMKSFNDQLTIFLNKWELEPSKFDTKNSPYNYLLKQN